VAPLRLEDENWELAVTDSGESSQRLSFRDAGARELIALLVERRLLAGLARQTALWTLDSPRIWYEPEPFHEEGDIRVFRSYRIATLPIDGVGVGIAADVSRAFFTAQPIAYFFDDRIAPDERRRRTHRFELLTRRQSGQKGTLIYDNGENRVKCYLACLIHESARWRRPLPREGRGDAFQGAAERFWAEQSTKRYR
jgi:hypothetical protein